MRKIITLAAIVLTAISLQAQTTQVVRWVDTVGGTSNSAPYVRQQDGVRGMVEDGQSNTYVIGNYTGKIDFVVYNTTTNGVATTISGTVTLTSVSGSQDIFIARYAIDGKCTWAASIGGSGFDEGRAIYMTNPSSPSDFYITGMFTNSMTVAGTTLNTVASGYAVSDAFVIRYNTTMTTLPTLNWKKAFGGYTETCATAIVHSGSNLYVTGYYTELILDSAVNILAEKTHNNGTTGSFTTPTPGYLEFPLHDMFVARITTSGAISAILRTNGSEDEVEGNGITLSGTDVFVTGTFKGSTEFTTTASSCSGHSDAFIAKYPTTFTSATAASAVTIIGGPSTTYQAAIGQPFYKQDEGYGIIASTFGIFATGRFMDQASFGTGGSAIDPSGSANETYMYLVRYPTTLAGAGNAVTGTGGYSEGRGIYLATGGGFSPTHSLFIVGGAVSTASVNGTQVETNGYTAENVGFVARIGYTGSTGVWANSFVDGIAQNQNGIHGTGVGDIDVVGYAVSYRVGCGVRIAGWYASKTAFGTNERAAYGSHDAFVCMRDNSVAVTSNTYNCGGGSVLLTGTGGTSPYSWVGPGVSVSTSTVTVTPSTTSTYTFTTATSGSCGNAIAPVTVNAYPSIASADAGPNKYICGATHSVIIGTVALQGCTYSWAPSGSLTGATTAQPTATVSSNVTYTMTMTDTCGNVTTDVMTVTYDAFCPHGRLAGPEETNSASFVVYPNPNNGQFTVSTSIGLPKNVMVYDVNGRLVYSVIGTTDANVAVDISGEAQGLYTVQVVCGDHMESMRVNNQ